MPSVLYVVDVHLLEVVTAFDETGFLDVGFYEVFHGVAAAVFAGVGVQAGFYSGDVVYEVGDVLSAHQFEQSGLAHEYCVLGGGVVGLLEVEAVLAGGVVYQDFGLAFGQEYRDAAEYLGILGVQLLEVFFDVRRAYE